MSSDLAIRVDSLGKRYRIGATQGIGRYRSLREEIVEGLTRKRGGRISDVRDFWALKDISLEVKAGEVLGIIGRNGAGKSTLLKILARITPPTYGRGETRGRVGSLLEVGTGFHPELTGRENIMLAAAIMGMGRSEVVSRFDEIVAFSGLEKFLDTPVKRYSSGMYMRLAFSVAAHLDPEILLVDEVLAVGDAEFQKKCLGRMEQLGGIGRTVLFVSHSLPSVLRLCPRVVLLAEGKVVKDGAASAVLQSYIGEGGGAAERRWPEPATAPGDNLVRLESVRVLGADGSCAPEVDISEPLTVEVTYTVLTDDPEFAPLASLHFTNGEGTLLFVTHANKAVSVRPTNARRRVTARCFIPGNLLSEGSVFVLVALMSYEPLTFHAVENDAVVFQVRDSADGTGARGGYVGDWPGAMRPILEWEESHVPIDTA